MSAAWVYAVDLACGVPPFDCFCRVHTRRRTYCGTASNVPRPPVSGANSDVTQQSCRHEIKFGVTNDPGTVAEPRKL